MSHRARRARHLTRDVIVIAVLLAAAIPAESAVQLAQPFPETEKAVSCSVGRPSEERVTHDQDKLPPDAPRVATRERVPDGKQAPRFDSVPPEVCPLHPEQEPGPPRGRP